MGVLVTNFQLFLFDENVYMLKCIHVTNTVFFSIMSYGVDEGAKLSTSLSQRKSFTSTKIFKALCSRTMCADLEH